jgi:hypothetical protein
VSDPGPPVPEDLQQSHAHDDDSQHKIFHRAPPLKYSLRKNSSTPAAANNDTLSHSRFISLGPPESFALRVRDRRLLFFDAIESQMPFVLIDTHPLVKLCAQFRP